MDFSERFYTAAEVAKILRVTRPTIYRLIKEGRILPIRIGDSGSEWRISSVRLAEFMKTQATSWPSEKR